MLYEMIFNMCYLALLPLCGRKTDALSNIAKYAEIFIPQGLLVLGSG